MRDARDRPEGLRAWTDLCEVVDQVRILVNRDLFERAGLTLAENLVLCQVAMSPQGRLRMVDLASHLAIAKSAVTKTVDRLEERRLVRRERDERDRRSVYAALTEDGVKAFAVAQPTYLESVQQHFASRLDPSVLRELKAISEQVLDRRTPDQASRAARTTRRAGVRAV